MPDIKTEDLESLPILDAIREIAALAALLRKLAEAAVAQGCIEIELSPGWIIKVLLPK